MGDKIKIGLLVSHMDDHFTQEMCRGAVLAGLKENVEVIIFPGRYLGLPEYMRRDDSASECFPAVYNYAKETGLSALVISIGTIGCFVEQEEREKFVSYFSPMPIVCTSMKVGDHPYVYISEQQGLREEIEHLVKAHKEKKIAYISGPEGHVDSEKRVQLYKKVLEENGIEFDPTMVIYSNFSHSCREDVEPFMNAQRAKGTNVFCFANDEMAAFGYDYANEHKLIIGEDIYIVGYDDNYVSTSLQVPMSTVRADASLLGFYGVIDAVRLHRGERVEDREIDSHFIVRDSCGCGKKFYDVNFSDNVKSTEQIAEEIIEYTIGDYRQVPMFGKYSENFKIMLAKYADAIKENRFETISTPESKHMFITPIFRMLSAMGPIERLPEIIKMFYEGILSMATEPAQKVEILKSQRRTMWVTNNYLLHLMEERTALMTYSSYFANDVNFATECAQGVGFYKAILDRLRLTRVSAACVYTYPGFTPSGDYDKWKKPDKLVLRCRFDEKGSEEIVEHGTEVGCTKIFDTLGEGSGMVFVIPLTGTTEHYGLLVCRSDFDTMTYIHTMASHLSVSIKIATLVDRLDNQLSEINHNAHMLRHLSITDDLTGIYNRRGFLETAGYMVHKDTSSGKRGLMIYGDIDRFKTINDGYGHPEGDDALRYMAQLLSKLSDDREKCICARVGGDEFAVLMILEDNEDANEITHRLVDLLETGNNTSNRPYRVDMSFGMVEFFCSPAVSLSAIISQADSKQYVIKQKRRKLLGEDI